MRRSWKMVHFIVPEFATMATLVHGCSFKKFLSKLSVRLVVSDLSRCQVSTHLILLGAASPETLYLFSDKIPIVPPSFSLGRRINSKNVLISDDTFERSQTFVCIWQNPLYISIDLWYFLTANPWSFSPFREAWGLHQKTSEDTWTTVKLCKNPLETWIKFVGSWSCEQKPTE